MKKPLKITLIVLAGLLVMIPIGHYSFQMLRRAVLMSYLTEERVIELWPKRGDIYDKDGHVILTTATFYDIHLDTALPEDSRKWSEGALELAAALDSLLPVRNGQEWLAYLNEGREKGNRYLLIAKGVAQEKCDSLRRLPLLNIFESHDVQAHPYGELARRTLGYSLDRNNGYVGLSGRYHEQMQGAPAERTVRLGWYKGHRQHLTIGQTEDTPASNLHTTLDMRLQVAADSAVRAALSSSNDLIRGCMVLMEVSTGAIRAIVNLDRDDRDDSFHEYYNAVIGSLYEPGEVVSPLSADADTTSPVLFVETLRSRCLPDKIDFDLAGLRRAYIPTPEDAIWNILSMRSMRKGYSLAMVPLDILSFYNTMARGGSMIKPYLVDSLTCRGETTMRYRPTVLKEHVSIPTVSDVQLRGARYEVAGKASTSRQAFIPARFEFRPSYTDSLGRQQLAISFAGFFPADDPKYSVICVLFTKTTCNHYYGGTQAANAVKELVNAVEL